MPAVLTTRLNISKIGVISDTHVPTRAAALPASLHEHFKNVDFIIHCGDLVDNNVLIELKAIAPVYAVKGNMDGPDIKEPEELVLFINNTFTVCAAHGTGSPYGLHERLIKKFVSYKPYMILYGHTHTADIGSFNGTLFFNPGSCTAGNVNNSIGLLEIKHDSIERKIIPL
jgi:putative phosphoesterase